MMGIDLETQIQFLSLKVMANIIINQYSHTTSLYEILDPITPIGKAS
jgi:hypothetical protein